MNNWTISFYTNGRGDELVQDFIRNQDEQTQSKITRNIDLVSKYGPNLGMPNSRYMGNGIYELRVRGNNEVRIFYISIITNREVMFIHGFKKRTQKTPTKELKIAINRKNELT